MTSQNSIDVVLVVTLASEDSPRGMSVSSLYRGGGATNRYNAWDLGLAAED